MVIYGVSFLGACYILGQLLGEFLAKWIGVKANVGGVGFAMLFLILANDYFNKRKLFSAEAEKGVLFWSQMYIPVIVAMSATQNVVVALDSGVLAILAGVIPVFMCFACIPFLVKLTKPTLPQ
jgi:malonate transporter MadL subunit